MASPLRMQSEINVGDVVSPGKAVVLVAAALGDSTDVAVELPLTIVAIVVVAAAL